MTLYSVGHDVAKKDLSTLQLRIKLDPHWPDSNPPRAKGSHDGRIVLAEQETRVPGNGAGQSCSEVETDER